MRFVKVQAWNTKDGFYYTFYMNIDSIVAVSAKYLKTDYVNNEWTMFYAFHCYGKNKFYVTETDAFKVFEMIGINPDNKICDSIGVNPE